MHKTLTISFKNGQKLTIENTEGLEFKAKEDGAIDFNVQVDKVISSLIRSISGFTVGDEETVHSKPGSIYNTFKELKNCLNELSEEQLELTIADECGGIGLSFSPTKDSEGNDIYVF